MQLTLLVAFDETVDRVVALDADAGVTVKELVATVAAAAGVVLCGERVVVRSTTRAAEPGPQCLDPAETVASARLRDGDRLSVLAPLSVQPAQQARGTARRVAIVAGPGSAGSVVLPSRGEVAIGRGADCSLRLRDDTASPLHLTVSVDAASGVVTVSDCGSLNGTLVEGLPIGAQRTTWSDGALVQAGNTRLALRHDEPPAPAPEGWGAHVWHRTPRLRSRRGDHRAVLPDVPASPTPPTFPFAAALVPVVLGIVLWRVLGNTMFLAFVAMGPAMAVWRFVEDRRRGNGARRSAQRRFVADLKRAVDELARVHRVAVEEARAASPDLAELCDRAAGWRANLWERRRDHDDFGSLRIGVADRPTCLDLIASAAPEGADRRLVAARDMLIARHGTDRSVPVVVDASGGVGVCGPAHLTDAVCRGLILQAAVLHGPADLAVAVLCPPARAQDWTWARWLPHTAILGSDRLPGGRGVADCTAESDALVSALAVRRGEPGAANQAAATPHVLVIADEDAVGDRVALENLLGRGRRDVSLVWATRKRSRLPECCETVVECRTESTTVSYPSGLVVRDVVADLVDAETALAAARALAPLRDSSARGGGRIPASVSFSDIAGDVTAETVAAGWAGAADVGPVPIGSGRDGPVTVDLVEDGPHGLVVGTTGSGKSELFTTLLISHAVSVPPRLLNFLLVDYKGGAAFARLADLPHAAGFVSDLEGDLAERVLVSLDAELQRRMRLFRSHGASELTQMRELARDDAPPRLFVVVDEFAALSRLVPAFVDGLVDIARRGRSLGVHLLIGTQLPDANTAKLSGNTNLRIALSVQSEQVSRDVLGVPDASRIARSEKGRALLRRGHGEVVELQTAYAGGPPPSGHPSVKVAAVDGVLPETDSAVPGPTELDAILEAVETAWRASGSEAVRSVWLPPLPPVVTLSSLDVGDGSSVPVGLTDEPHRQIQRERGYDLEADGHLLVTGPSGAGRTTLCRTLAASLSSRHDPSETAFYVLDFAGGGLACLSALPHCAGVVTAGQVERVDRLFAILEEIVACRRSDLAASGCSTVVEYRNRRGRDMPTVILLLDGYGAFAAAHDDWSGGHVDTLRRVVEDGRSAGVHVVVTADRGSSVPARLAEALGTHVRLGGEGGQILPGRATDPDGTQWQVAVAGADPSYAAQVGAIETIGASAFPEADATAVPRPDPLPESVAAAEITCPPERGWSVIGLCSCGLEPAAVDLGAVPLFLVAGPMRSGRSTALGTLACGFARSTPGAKMVLLAPRPSPLVRQSVWQDVAGGPDACARTACALAELAASGSDDDGSGTGPLLVAVDDAEMLVAGPAASALETLARRCWDVGVVLVAAGEAHALARCYGWIGQLRAARSGLLLRPDADADGEVFRLRLPRRRGYSFPCGRGELVAGDTTTLVQVAR